MLEKFGSKRNWSWDGWYIAKSMTLVFWLYFVTWWCVEWKTKIMVLENWLGSILTNTSKLMWEKFESKRNWSWHCWCIAKCMILVFWLNFVTWWCVGVKNENHCFGKLVGLNPHKCLQSYVGEVWKQKELILTWLVQSKVHDFGVFAWFCDLLVCGVKKENHGFGKLAGLNPHKCLQSHVGVVWEQKELILAWLVQNQVPWFWCFGLILWLGGVLSEKRKSWFWKTGWTQSSQIPPKSYGRSLGAKGIDLGMVGARASCMILVFWLDFMTRWGARWKTKIMVLENWLYSILKNASKVMWENFGNKRNCSWHGWCMAKSIILLCWLDFVTWWCVGWKTKIMVLENWLDSILTNTSKVRWEKFVSKRNWSWHCWFIAKCMILLFWLDFVTWWWVGL